MKVKAQTKLQLAPSAWGKSTQVGREVKHDIYRKLQTANAKMKFSFYQNTEKLDLLKVFYCLFNN